mgnify:CR=1 FL=1
MPIVEWWARAYARRCTYCDEWADGQWGTAIPARTPPPETGTLYTCRRHWTALQAEAQRAGGQPHLRPLFLDGMLRIGMWDTRLPDPVAPQVRTA